MVTPRDAATQVARRVAAEITRADRTAAWVARQAGIPLTTLRRKLSGTSDFTIREIARIAQVLDVHESSLVPDSWIVVEVA